MLEPAHKNKVNLVELSPEYQCGVALQSGIADLMLPESHTRNEDLIAMAVRNFPLESILTRGVPGSTFDTFGTRPDSSEFACDFIAKCECIITRASNMAYEALLYGRQMYCAEKGLYQFKGMHDLNYPKAAWKAMLGLSRLLQWAFMFLGNFYMTCNICAGVLKLLRK